MTMNEATMTRKTPLRKHFTYLIPALASLLAWGGTTADCALAVSMGNMKADSILVLGNSITLHGPYIGWSTEGDWGMAASEKSKDYVHLLAGKISAATGAPLTVAHPNPLPGRWYPSNPLPNWQGNILNIADLFERNYNTWDNARIKKQIDAKPDIVVLQLGENMEGGTMDQFATALDSLLTALKESSNPNIFITSHIIGSDPAVDAIKRHACAKDPSHRVFVDLNGRVNLSGEAGHPNDAGMVTIADTIYGSMQAHAVPEPGTLSMAFAAAVLLAGWSIRRKGPQ
jgi:hypothetical protein